MARQQGRGEPPFCTARCVQACASLSLPIPQGRGASQEYRCSLQTERPRQAPLGSVSADRQPGSTLLLSVAQSCPAAGPGKTSSKAWPPPGRWTPTTVPLLLGNSLSRRPTAGRSLRTSHGAAGGGLCSCPGLWPHGARHQAAHCVPRLFWHHGGAPRGNTPKLTKEQTKQFTNIKSSQSKSIV